MGRNYRMAVAGIATILTACSGPENHSEVAVSAPTLEEVRNSTVTGVFDDAVQFVDGRWEGEPYAPGGASRPSAGVAGDLLLTGDLTGDGVEEAVVFLWTASGGSGTRNYVAVFESTASGIVNKATAPIGDRVQVRAARIVDNRVEVDVVQHDDDDAMCCPTANATRSWAFDGNDIREAPVMVHGPMDVSDLEGYEWRLVRFGSRELTNPGKVTLVVDGERVAGQAPCNRYFGAIRNGESPGELELGQLASTRMACADEAVMREEQEFLAALSSVNRFAFVTGQLVLTATSEEGFETLQFEPAEPESATPDDQ